MKKVIKYFMLATIICLASCSTEKELDQAQTGKIIRIGVGLDDETRVAYTDTDRKQVWEEGDELILVGLDERSQYIEQSIFTIVSGQGRNKATFEGKIVNGVQYYLVYKTPNIVIPTQNWSRYPIFKHEGQIQNGINSTAHLKNFTALTNQGAMDYLRSDYPLLFDIENSLLRINLKSLPKEVKNFHQIRIVLNAGNGEEEKILGSLKLQGNMELTPGADNMLYLQFATDGNVLNPGRKIAIDFIGNDKSFRASAISQNGKQYSKGHIYNITVNTDSGDKKSLNTWEETNVGHVPYKNEIWCKPAQGKSLNSSFFTLSTNYTLHPNPNSKGWYVYTADSTPDFSWAVNLSSRNDIAEVFLPAECNKIDSEAFYQCTNLKTVNIPEGVEILDGSTFYGCRALTEITLPSTVKSIGWGEFAYTDSFKKLTILAPAETLKEQNIDSGWFYAANGSIDDLYIHESWKSVMNGDYFHIQGKHFYNCYFIDNEGKVVEEHHYN